AEVRPHVENAFAAAWRGEAEVDGFNELVLRAGPTWRQVVVLRAYAKYLRQAGTVFSQEYMEQTFIGYPRIAGLLVELFEARFEGVHLRFGPVARGGLRWSDRREDFRTEVLGLVKAQMVKNAVIVPVGAKGGFVLKQKPGDRDEAVACYQEFVGALLDVTDNI